MLREERFLFILNKLEQENFVKITEIATHLNISEMTIRRDIEALAKDNKLLKIHGGAKKIAILPTERSTQEKMNRHLESKKYIGKVLNSLIQDYSVIYLGAGTTIFHALPYITKKKLKIITNSLLAFNYLVEETEYETFLASGRFIKRTSEFVGDYAEGFFDRLNIDISVVATNGIFNNNITTSTIEQGNIQQASFKNTKLKYVIADSSKLNTSDIYTFYKLSDMDGLITDNLITTQDYKYYSQYVKIYNKPIDEATLQ